jgi:O-antigen ligase
MQLGQRTFAPILAAMLVLWPIIAYMGAQGYSAAVAIAALLGLFFARRPDIDRLFLSGTAFAFWVVIASLWGPDAEGLFVGDVGSGSFSLDMPGIRFALTALAGLGIFVALQSVNAGGATRSLKVIVGAGWLQFGGVVVTALFMAQVLALLAPISDPVSEMPQNIMRNANAFLMLLPFLLAWLWQRGPAPKSTYAAIALGTVSFLAFALTGTQTALMGVGLMLVTMGIVKRYKISGFKIIFGTLAAYVLVAPLIFSGLIARLRDLGIPLPKSFFSRSYSWELVGTKIAESPVIGHGPEASQGWQDKFGDHPEWLADASARYGAEYAWEVYRVIPSHPHNMPLQVWAETGLIGAALVAAFLLFLGWRLPPPSAWSPISRYAAAGLIGACIAICSFAYSMWNEAFWGSVILAAAVIYLQARHDGQASEAA